MDKNNNRIETDIELIEGSTLIGFSKDYKGEYSIPNYITTIGEDGEDGPFCGCKVLESVHIPDSVTTINSSAFYDCINIKKIIIPKNVSFISLGIIGGCNNLSTIIVDKDNRHYDSREDCNAIVDSNSHILIAGCYTSRIPFGVKGIGDCAFVDCPRLTEISIPNSVMSIGNLSFSGCSNLITINIPEGVTSIGNEAFSGCSKLSTITLPNSINEIGRDTFSNCEELKEIIIPNGTRQKFKEQLPEYLHDKLKELKQ